MIKFFRKIRQNLLSEDKTGKYFKYAIGEIVLVVIGILIALQINTWNESRKQKQVEKQVLKSLFQEIEKDKTALKQIDYQYKKDLLDISYFKKLFWKEQHSMADALDLKKFFGFVNYDVNPNRITYDEMINTGKLYYLSNQNLLNKIIDYYELIDGHIYLSRQDRIEFRANFFNVSQMKEFWLTVYENNNELAYNFAQNQNTEIYKSMKVLTEYSYNLTRTTKASVVNLYEKAQELQLLINEELDGSLILVNDKSLSEEKALRVDETLPKNLSGLVSSGKSTDEIIEIIKNQDNDKPKFDISENQINILGYLLMRQEKNQDALKFFKLNTELYPNGFNTYDSYGECLLKLGDTENGIKAYQKSLELNPDNTNAKIMLFQFE
jgi:predicted negative regulator of RcsB-dependent stress response